jgi:hypothetical protein
MSDRHLLLRLFKTICLVSTLGVSMSAYGMDQFSWKEEVLLHDGSKIVVTRSQSHGGRGETGQSPIKEHSITFTLPGSNKSITWKDEYSDDVGHSNFDLLALHILNDTPYIVAFPYGSIAYKKWGSPNPPYVFFKYDGNTWQRIPLIEFPSEFKNINVVINTSAHEAEINSQSLVRTEAVKKFNSSLKQEEYKNIIRTPLDHWKPRPEHKGPKAPNPIPPSTTTEGKK